MEPMGGAAAPSSRRWWLAIVAVAMVGLVAVPLVMRARSSSSGFVVDDAGDAPDTIAGDGRCTTSTGACTLRAAVMEANARPGADAITFTGPLAVTLSATGTDEDAAATGDLDITDELAIDGGGASVDATGIDRVLHVHAVPLRLDALTVTGGRVDDEREGDGAGILLESGAVLEATDLTVSGNVAAGDGGGIALRRGGSATITHSVVTGNRAADGGGIAADLAVLAVHRSALTENSASTGAAVDSRHTDLLIENSTVAENQVDDTTGRQGSDHRRAAIAVIGAGADPATSQESHGTPDSTEPGTTVASVGSAPARIAWSTFVHNSGAGVHVSGQITLAGTIVAEQDGGPGCTGPTHPVSEGANIDADGSCGLTDPSDLTVPPLLAPADGTGADRAAAPQAASPAVDSGATGCGALDQRGNPRPARAACDRGAIELAGPQPGTSTPGSTPGSTPASTPGTTPGTLPEDQAPDVVELGGPHNYLGTSGVVQNDRLALGISSPCRSKEQGDRFNALTDHNYEAPANSSQGGSSTFVGCQPGVGSVVANHEHDDAGYTFAVAVPPTYDGEGSLRIDAVGLAFCPGSSSQGGSNGPTDDGKGPVTTTFTVRDRDGNILQGPTAVGEDAKTRCSSKWSELITIDDVAPADRYLVQIQTPAPDDTSTDPGSNRFGLRAFLGDEFVPCSSDPTDTDYDDQCPALFALGRAHLYLQVLAAATPFDLIATGRDDAGKTLAVELWDTGEGMRAIQLRDPLGDPVEMTVEVACQDGTFMSETGRSCADEAEPKGGYGPFVTDELDVSAQSCANRPTPNTLSCSQYNDRLLRFTVSLPDDLSAAYGGASWWQLVLKTGGSTPTDALTVSASVR